MGSGSKRRKPSRSNSGRKSKPTSKRQSTSAAPDSPHDHSLRSKSRNSAPVVKKLDDSDEENEEADHSVAETLNKSVKEKVHRNGAEVRDFAERAGLIPQGEIKAITPRDIFRIL